MIHLTRAQVREVDRRAIERYYIPGIVLMENASQAAADVACSMLAGSKHARVLILCGGGNNGGDGLAVARHLHNRGLEVRIALTIDPARYQGDALVNWRIVQTMEVPVIPADPDAIAETDASLIIDAIFGTGLTQPPRPPFAQVAAAIERSGRPVLAIDLPSGLDCDTGEPLGVCIRATQTVTFVAEKAGFANPASRAYTGEVTVADIGCPPEIIAEILAGS
jgi:NAD(P)H-hydrate epimerase